jgi:hypothetical protein
MKKIFLLILLFTISNFAFAESVVEEGPKSKTEISKATRDSQCYR